LVVAFGSARDFVDQARVLFDRHMGGKTETIVGMGTAGDIEFFADAFQGRAPESGALFEARKSQALSFSVEAVGPAQQAAGRKGPAVFIVAPCHEGLSGQVLVSAVVVDDGDSAPGTNVGIVAGDVVFGIGDVQPGPAAMVCRDLVVVYDDQAALFGVAGDVGDGHGQLDFKMQLNRCGQHGVVAEDLLFFVGVAWVSSDPDSGIGVPGQLGAADGHGSVIGIDARDSGAQRMDAQLMLMQLLLQAEHDGCVSLFLRQLSIGKREPAGKQLDSGLFNILRDPVTGTLGVDTDLGTQIALVKLAEAVDDAASDFFHHVGHDDLLTPATKPGTALISGPRGIKRAVMCEDVEADHLQAMKDADQHVKDFVVEPVADAGAEMRKGSLTGDVVTNAGIGPVRMSPAISNDRQERAHVGIAFDVAEQVQQEKTGRVVTRRPRGPVTMSHHGTDERKIDQGNDHFHQPAAHIAVGQDLHEAFFEAVI